MKLISTVRPIALVRPRLAGHFRLTAHKLDGSSRLVAEFENLILTAGLNRMGTGLIGSHCQVGTGSTAPAITDTALQSILVASSTIQASTFGYNPSSPYYSYATRTYRFGIGVAAGNLSEVGIGWAASGSLFSRALILDGEGDPTPITILGDEILDVQYELRIYPPETDVTGTVSVGGDDYDYVIRAASVTSTSWNQFGVSQLLSSSAVVGSPSLQSRFYEGAIGAITGTPSGTSGVNQTAASATYGNNSMYRDVTMSATIDQGNFPTGIGAASLGTTAGVYQIGFTPKLTKNNTKTLSLTMRVAWARKTL